MRGTFARKAFILLAAVSASGAFAALPSGAAPARQDDSKTVKLDFEFFKARVEPIFLKRRPGHARCYACHASNTGPQYLVKLSPGATFWDEEQSRKIFQNVSRLIDHSDPMNSRFLLHPLSPMAGGDAHAGGRQFESRDDPDWKNMAAWARGEKLPSSSGAQ
jgi:hypothetical protein